MIKWTFHILCYFWMKRSKFVWALCLYTVVWIPLSVKFVPTIRVETANTDAVVIRNCVIMLM